MISCRSHLRWSVVKPSQGKQQYKQPNKQPKTNNPIEEDLLSTFIPGRGPSWWDVNFGVSVIFAWWAFLSDNHLGKTSLQILFYTFVSVWLLPDFNLRKNKHLLICKRLLSSWGAQCPCFNLSFWITAIAKICKAVLEDFWLLYLQLQLHNHW